MSDFTHDHRVHRPLTFRWAFKGNGQPYFHSAWNGAWQSQREMQSSYTRDPFAENIKAANESVLRNGTANPCAALVIVRRCILLRNTPCVVHGVKDRRGLRSDMGGYLGQHNSRLQDNAATEKCQWRDRGYDTPAQNRLIGENYSHSRRAESDHRTAAADDRLCAVKVKWQVYRAAAAAKQIYEVSFGVWY